MLGKGMHGYIPCIPDMLVDMFGDIPVDRLGMLCDEATAPKLATLLL